MPKFDNLLYAASLTALAGAGISSAATLPTERPNLIMIVADDLGYGDLSCYGSTTQMTPEIDRLAEQGVRCTDFYVTSAVCTPSREALLTGRHPARIGFSALLWPTSKGGMPNTERTLAEILQENGYATGLIGKWHLGHSEKRYLPLANGFDYFYGMPYPNDMGPDHPQTVARNEVWPPMPMMLGNDLIESGINVNLLTQQYTAEALAFIAREHHRPFFLYLAHAMPHTIIGASPDFAGKSKNGLYGDAVQEEDWSTGEIMRALRAYGLDQNTLVVFFSDNGAVMREQYKGDDQKAQAMFPDLTFGSNGILRGGKQSTFDGGVHVPAIFRWPGVIPPNQVQTGMISVADILPTFLDYAGIPLPDDRTYDGISVRASLDNTPGAPNLNNRTLAFGGGKANALRVGQWKLVLPNQPRFVPGVGNQPMLFDLSTDPGETHDLAAENPKQLQAMLNRLDAWAADAAADTVSRGSESQPASASDNE